jgi:beta-lactamase class D
MKFAFFFLLILSGCVSSKNNKELHNNKVGFVLFEEGKGVISVNDSSLVKTRYSPCSTFKVPHAVFGLDSGYITGKDFTLEYDPQKNPQQSYWPNNWSQDHDLESAVKNSVVWYFQNVARNIGHKKMAHFLAKAKFGNQDISGGIDEFWLGSSLKISPLEQVELWSKLFKHQLGFKKENVDLVKEIILEEKTPKYTLRAKTGACTQPNNQKSAWWVGSLEQNGKTYYFSTILFGGDFAKLFSTRKKVTKRLLKKEGLL